jgi:PCFT/HCP family folate transporter-like MFS transporter 1/3
MYLILLSTVGMTVPTLVSVGYIGSWSDKYGRKVPLMFPCVGNVLAGLAYMAVAYWPSDVPVETIIVSSVLSGLFGGFVATVMAVMSYMASITDPETRTMRVSILESMTFLGKVFFS